MRPTFLHIGGTLYWTIYIYNPDTSILKDADETPIVVVRKNGSSTGDSVTITKRSATTGIYDCSYNPSAEVEGDEFLFEESAVVTGSITSQATYNHIWAITVISFESGLDASGIRSAIGLASANLDTQLSTIDDFLDTEVAAIKAKTDNLPASPAAVSDIPTAIQIREEMDSNSVKLSEIKALTILGSGDQTSTDFSNDYYNAIADAVLTRNVSNVEDTLEEHTLGGAIMGQLEWSLDGSGNLTVYKTDGTTELYTKVVNSTTSDGNVITGLE